MGMRLVVGKWIFVAHAGVPTGLVDGFPRGQLSREKAMYASTDEEGLLVLQVQASQYGEVASGAVIHVSVVEPGVVWSM